MTKPVRRIVTGHHADGRSTVLMDEFPPHTGGDAVCRLGMVFIDAEEPPELG